MFRIALGKRYMTQYGAQTVDEYVKLQTYGNIYYNKVARSIINSALLIAIMPLNIFAPWLPFGAAKKANQSRSKLYKLVQKFIEDNKEYEVRYYIIISVIHFITAWNLHRRIDKTKRA